MWKYILAWIPMVLIAILNALLRESVFAKHLSELQSHQLSTATALALFGVYVWAVIRVWRPASSGQALSIGLLWLGLTVAFEFLFGHYVMRHPWGRLLHDYNLFVGRLWVIVLIWVTVAPYTLYRLQK